MEVVVGEDLAEVDVEIFPKDMFEFGEARIAGDNKGTGARIVGGSRG